MRRVAAWLCQAGLSGALLAGGAGALAQQPQQPAPNREFTVANETDQILREFYAAPAGVPDRAGDRLGSDTVAAGGTYRVRLGRTRDCLFDLRAVFQDDSVEERRRVDVCRAQRVTFGDPSLPWLEVEVANASDRTLRELYASPQGPAAWGADRLGTEVVAPGQSQGIRLRTRECSFQLRAVWEDDAEEVLPARDLCASRRVVLDRATLPQPTARPVTLVNRHLAPVQEAYVSASAEADWGPDRLGTDVLPPGEATTFDVAGACEADIRVVFPGGGAEERREVDICENPRIVIRPGWVVADRLDEEGPVAALPDAAAGASRRPVPQGAVRLRNAARLPIVEIYADPPGAPRGPDRLGAAILGAGEALELLPPRPDACTADLTAVFRDGREARQAGVNLCSGQEIEIR